MRVADFLEESNAAETPEEVFRLFCSAVADLGYNRAAFAAEKVLAKSNQSPVFTHNYPGDWADHYFDKQYQEIDPVLLLTASKSAPFLRDEIVARYPLSAKQRLMRIGTDPTSSPRAP